MNEGRRHDFLPFYRRQSLPGRATAPEAPNAIVLVLVIVHLLHRSPKLAKARETTSATNKTGTSPEQANNRLFRHKHPRFNPAAALQARRHPGAPPLHPGSPSEPLRSTAAHWGHPAPGRTCHGARQERNAGLPCVDGRFRPRRVGPRAARHLPLPPGGEAREQGPNKQ
jgi:hypothetical protein